MSFTVRAERALTRRLTQSRTDGTLTPPDAALGPFVMYSPKRSIEPVDRHIWLGDLP
jgi:hypothetical protein